MRHSPAKRDLSAWLTYYKNLHPVGIDMGLSRVNQVWQNLCRIYNIKQLAQQKTITVSGTNGKGSTCQMLSMLLSQQGYKVGMYSSPHIHQFNERVKLNHCMVDDDTLIKAFEAIDHARESITVSYFEASTLAGLLIFAWEAVDFAILEVGLGGKLDAVNVIDADAVIMTSIGLDHASFLGSDLQQIAIEKAGICRTNRLAVYGHTQTFPTLEAYFKQHKIPAIIHAKDYVISNNQLTIEQSSFTIPDNISALGKHQIRNAAAVIVLLYKIGKLPNNYQQILAEFFITGRMQKIAENPDVILDVAHNVDSIEALVSYVNKQNHYQQSIAVIGMLKDKDHQAVFAALQGVFDDIYFGGTTGGRGISADALKAIADEILDTPTTACCSLTDALAQAKKKASMHDVIYAFGSFLVVSELLNKSSS